MKRLTIAAATVVLCLGTAFAPVAFAQTASQAAAALTETTFYVEGMTCGTCPLTVRAAMGGVEGVQSVEVNFETRTALVVFDPALTDAAAIALASEHAGYPAAVKG